MTHIAFCCLARPRWVLHGLACLLFTASITAHAAAESGSASGENSSPGAQRLREELRILLMDLVQSGAFSQTPVDHIALTVEIPSGRVADLGVLVDSSSGDAATDGLLVLGTTPGSLSSRLGLRSGDILISVNEVPLVALGSDGAGSARAARVLRDALDALDDGAALEFRLTREGKALSIAGRMESVLIPSARLQLGDVQVPVKQGEVAPGPVSDAAGCGRISTFDNAPRQQQLHAATLIDIDDKKSPIAGQTSVRVSVGRHVFKVGEKIDVRYLGFGERLRDRGGNDRYKTIIVDVEPNTTYFLAAKINAEHSNEWRDGAYWDPVVWSSSIEGCK